MASPKPMYIRYAEAFADQSLGHALLHPCPTNRLYPGVCGYFDVEGDWHTILDIPDLENELKMLPPELKFTTLEDCPPIPPSGLIVWEPKCSADVTYSKFEEQASATYSPIKAPSTGFLVGYLTPWLEL